jgi:hypothetical protein
LKRFRRVGLGLIVVGSIAVTAVLLTPVWSAAYGVAQCFLRPDTFDGPAWRSTDIDALCNARVQMVDDLVAGDELRPGRSRAEIEGLLGPTEETELWLSEEDGLVYQTSCWIDCTWLVIEFDDQQRSVKAYTAQD